MWHEGFARAREKKGLNQTEAAKRIDVTRQYLSRIETGDKEPSFAVLSSMARVYGCHMADLFGRSTDLRHTDLAPLMAELYGIAPEKREAIIEQLAALARSFAVAYAQPLRTEEMAQDMAALTEATSRKRRESERSQDTSGE